MPKTEMEKSIIKEAKKAYKANKRSEIHFQPPHKQTQKQRTNYILEGVMADETLLDDNYPVYFNYLYVVDDNGGKVVISDIEGTVAQLKSDLKKLGFTANNIHKCNLKARNII